ncbi:MAG: lytic transglycosylase domain-containing protein [Sphingomonas bacterium]|nr:lytic transglycosylase domain-containing protein [Sphingomonas bacterium]
MRRLALLTILAAAPSGSVFAQAPAYPAPTYGAPAVSQTEINYAIADWRRLRTSDGYAFADYARFLNLNPDWPDDNRLRGVAERQMRPGEYGPTVIAFFRTDKPRTGNGRARLAEALAAAGRKVEAATIAREAWASGDLPTADEATIAARYWANLNAADHDQRADALLFARKTEDAARATAYASPARRAAFAARVAMQRRSPDADALYRLVDAQAASDAGLLVDRVRFLRLYNNEAGARSLAARPQNFIHRPADQARFVETMLSVANGAYGQRQYQQAYDIGRQINGAFAPGTDMTTQSYAIRDDYTSLVWLAGQSALSGINRPALAAQQFVNYSKGGKSLQVASKGLYWAGRAALYAGQAAQANAYFAQAAAYPELFYGQLALERLGRPMPVPAVAPAFLVTPIQRAAFQRNRLAQATRLLGQQGRRDEQTLFVRALAESLTNDGDRVLASDFGPSIGRQDVAVWTARAARNNGSAFYYRSAFPTHSSSVPSGKMWSLVHGITRQESSFDRAAMSRVGARGMMQLMPATAREESGKIAVGYDLGRLTSDPSYNVMLGSSYFRRMVGQWGGNYVLAVASYNAGAGNVRKWVRAYGDPRSPGVDTLRWIEQIPFSETKGYVQRVMENSVVYDRINPTLPLNQQSVSLSTYLGKSRPG